MKIEIKDVITLSDSNKYVVCSKINYQGDNYLYLIDINNVENIKFTLEKITNNKIKILEIENENLIRTLLPLFLEAGKDIIPNEI